MKKNIIYLMLLVTTFVLPSSVYARPSFSALQDQIDELKNSSDGVILINQEKAIEGNVTPGDTPGFPITISITGSYRLSGNLTTPNADTSAIDVVIGGVTIDLNGFSILGPTVCFPTQGCTPAGEGVGIKNATKVFNGFVKGMGKDGIRGNTTLVEKIGAVSNGGYGIFIGDNSRVSNSVAINNGQIGISTGINCTVEGNEVSGNSGTIIAGIQTGGQCTVIGNTANDNLGSGIDAGGKSVVINNTSSRNGRVGIICRGGGCVIQGNVSSSNQAGGISTQNGSTVKNNVTNENLDVNGAGFGISSGLGSTIIGNTALENSGKGLSFPNTPSGSGYVNNVLNENNGGNSNPQVFGSGVEIGINLCGGDVICP